MNRAAVHRLHCDPANWRFGFIYFCRTDRRLFVPKRLRCTGVTLNFARPLAVPVFLLLILLALSAAAFLRGTGG